MKMKTQPRVKLLLMLPNHALIKMDCSQVQDHTAMKNPIGHNGDIVYFIAVVIILLT